MRDYRLLTRALLRPLAVLALAVAANTGAASEPAMLVAEADAIRNPAASFSFKVSLAEYRKGKLAGSSVITVHARPAPETGQYNNLVRYLSPAQDTGKLVLRNGMDLWFYDPSSKSSVRISPQARLLGQASNSDVMATNLSKDYSAERVGEEKVTGAWEAPVDTVHLKLKARHGNAPYDAVDYWVEQSTRKPVKAQFFTREGRLLKTAVFRRYQNQLGTDRPTETVIIDGLNPQWVTVMRTSDYVALDIPAVWLQRDYLPRFSGD